MSVPAYFRPAVRGGLTILWLLLTHVAQAQHDVILRTDGREIKAKVLVVAPDAIRYIARPDSAAADTLQLAAAEVFLIRYANGAREVIHRAAPQPWVLAPAEARLRGASDARQYYTGRRAFWVAYGVTVLSPVAGLATSIGIAARRPNASTFKVPDAELLRNPDYLRSYQQQARRQRAGKAMVGFGAGVGTLLMGAAILAATALH
ncbi:hypothetical protein LGH70_03115 [Hymenobacter sp. BT635]|uniref:Uncharacterized protein n=1 Tax=Hymenobacter nitidus TaxID=2880929 RepID=A0ABS8A833_9BACT|nr:hypothetical protein [Hymenobacter nitidus]MCB2376555.1 hypothetical protein [Hymenobacter nitidus]